MKCRYIFLFEMMKRSDGVFCGHCMAEENHGTGVSFRRGGIWAKAASGTGNVVPKEVKGESRSIPGGEGSVFDFFQTSEKEGPGPGRYPETGSLFIRLPERPE